jgi:hypothetical protein
MSRRAIAVSVFIGLVMTFSLLRADVLKSKNDGTIVAVGQFKGASEHDIYWVNCDGNSTTYAPPKGYLYKPGDNDCNNRGNVGMIGHSGGSSSAAGASADVGWREIPVTDPKPQTLGPR